LKFSGIVDLNIAPKDGKLSQKSVRELQEEMKKSGVVGYMMPQLKSNIDSESELTLLETLNSGKEVEYFSVVSGVDRDGKITEIASLSENVYAIYIESSIDINRLQVIFQYAQMLNKPIICHITHKSFRDGSLYDVGNSFRFGHPTRSQLIESVEVSKIVEIARHFGVKTLFQGVTSERALEVIKSAKRDGERVFIEVSIHHLVFDDSIYGSFNNYTKIDPPFQSSKGRDNLIKLLQDGTVDMLTSLHREVSQSEKSGSFKESSYGVIGLENIFSLYFKYLVKSGFITLQRLEELTSKNQLKFLGVERETSQLSFEETASVFSKNSLYRES
jgi:dihydroorotase